MPKEYEIKWLSEPEAHDYPAALSYLRLLYDEKTARAFVEKLKRAGMVEFNPRIFSGHQVFRCSESAIRM